MTPPGEPRSNGRRTHHAHAKGPESDESAVAPRIKRHHRAERNEDTRRHSGGRTRPDETRSTLPWKVRSPRETVAKSLEGDYRAEHLFALRQSLTGFRFYQKLIREVDEELEGAMRQIPRAEGTPDQMPPRTKKCFYQKAGNEPAFDLKAELFGISGVDLTDVPGISAITAHTILSEVGPDLSRFRSASAFTSWLGLCPDKKVSGGKVLHTGHVRSRTASRWHSGLVHSVFTMRRTISGSTTAR